MKGCTITYIKPLLSSAHKVHELPKFQSLKKFPKSVATMSR